MHCRVCCCRRPDHFHPRYADAPGASTNQPIDYSRKIVSTEVRGSIRTDRTIHYAGSGCTALEVNVSSAANPDPKRGSHPSSRRWWPIHRQTPPRSARDRQVDQWRQCAKRSAIRQVDPGDPSAEAKFADVVVTDRRRRTARPGGGALGRSLATVTGAANTVSRFHSARPIAQPSRSWIWFGNITAEVA